MPEINRSSPWSQGDIFTLRIEGEDELLGVVASHDCDLFAGPELEPEVEFVPARKIDDVNGQVVFAKSPRKLHCKTLDGDDNQGAVELLIRERRSLDKLEFFRLAAAGSMWLLDTEKVVFRNWLAARYARSAFPNAFEDRLDDKLKKKIEALSDKAGKIVRAIYFDLDDGKMLEREPEELYELRIHVVYDTETDEDDSAHEFAQALDAIFMKSFFDQKSHEWKGIVVLSCEATSSYNFPLVLANAYKPWRVDHRSYRALPDAIYPELGR